MCGILCVSPGRRTPGFQIALNAIAHRGPDGQGTWHSPDNRVSLGHRRLAILDRSDAGSQPFDSHGYVVVFNGEIYNFLELRETLRQKGFSFVTETDTEVLTASLRAWGKDALLKFNGMWAFAAWDKATGELFVARDRFGVKPLFYTTVEGGYAFASEMKALFPFLPRVERSRHFGWCLENLYEYESTENCLIEGVYRFPAGHFATVGNGTMTLSRYWHAYEHLEKTVPKTYDEQVGQFRELFLDACRIRMRSDVRLGTSLSGGVDSTAVVCALAHVNRKHAHEARISNDWQNAFVAGFPETEFDETAYAQSVARYLGIPIQTLSVTPPSLDALFQEQWFFEEIYPTPSTPMMFVYRKMRESGVVVSIDGHGADELLGGYHNVLLHAWADSNFNLAKAKEIHQTFKECFFFNSDKNFRIRDYIRFMMGRKKVLLAKYTYRPVAEKLWGLEPERRMGEFNYALYQLYTKTVLPTLLRNYDRYSMASGIEVRMPMMDWRLATYSMALPWTAKLRGGYTKAILRDAAAVFSPRDVIYRKSKIGYSAPVHRWLNGIWKNDVIDLIFSQDFLTLETIDAQAVHKKYGSALANGSLTMNEGFGLWQALCPYFWEKAMLKPKNEFVANYEAV